MTRSFSARRAFLKSAAMTFSLPFLESVTATARAASDRKRLLCLALPNGVWRPAWFPTTFGSDYTLSPTLAPLAKVKSKMLVLTGLDNGGVGDTSGAHLYSPAGLLTCVLAAKNQVRVGISMDQVVANAMAGKTRIHSMQLGLGDVTYAQAGYSAIYGKAISYRSATQPLTVSIKPNVIFDLIFAGDDAAASATERQRQRALRKSVLDYALEETRALQARLSSSDRVRLDEYSAGVRALEQQIDAFQEPPACAKPAARPPVDHKYPELARIMSDLIVLAFRCDTTRVITHILGPGGNLTSFSFIGVPDGHHAISHHKMQPANIEKLIKIDRWHIEQVAYLLEKMDAIDEGGQTMLDSSVALVSNEISDGDRHDQSNKPMLVVGRAGGSLKGGRHLSVKTNQANLYLTLMNLLGASVQTFGMRGTSPLAL